MALDVPAHHVKDYTDTTNKRTRYRVIIPVDDSYDDFQLSKLGAATWAGGLDAMTPTMQLVPASQFIQNSKDGSGNFNCRNALFRFDTEQIPDDAVIEGVDLRYYQTASAGDNDSDTSLYCAMVEPDPWPDESLFLRIAPVATEKFPIHRLPLNVFVPWDNNHWGGFHFNSTLAQALNLEGYSAYRLSLVRDAFDVAVAPNGANHLTISTGDHPDDSKAPYLEILYWKYWPIIGPVEIIPSEAEVYTPLFSRADGLKTIGPVPAIEDTSAVYGFQFVGQAIYPEFIEDTSRVFEPNLVQADPAPPVEFPLINDAIPPMPGVKPQPGLKPGVTSYVFTPEGITQPDQTIQFPFILGGGEVYPMRFGRQIDYEKQYEIKKQTLIRREITGLQGPTTMETKVYISDEHGRKRRLLDDVTSCSITMSNFDDATWSITLSCGRQKDFDPEKDWILPVVEVHVNGLGVQEYPMGLYRFFDELGGSIMRDSAGWELNGTSGETMFLNDTTRSIYTVPKGEFVLRRVRSLLRGRGVPEHMISLPMNADKKITNALVFDPFSDETSANVLGIINKLLKAGGFYALYTLNDGTYTTSRIVDIDRIRPHRFFGPPDEKAGAEPMLIEGISESKNREGWANAVVVTSEDPVQAKTRKKDAKKEAEHNQTEVDPEKAKPIKAIAENQKSFDDLGYWKVKQVKYKHITDMETARVLARAQLKAASSKHQTVGYSIMPDPDHGPKQAVRLFHETEHAKIDGIYKVVNFSWDLSSGENTTPQAMSFEAAKGDYE